MLRGYRLLIAAIAGLAIAFGAGLCVSGLLLAEQKQERSITIDPNAMDASKRPQQYLAERSGIPASIEAAISNPQPATGQDHEKRDLAAQEASAAFAWWMVVVSGLGFCITTIGTFLLYQQIKLTRRAVEDTGEATVAMREANRIAEHVSALELRPYVWFGKIEIRDVALGKIPQLVVEVCHAGQTPAYEVRSIVCFALLSPGIDNIRIRFDRTVKSAVPSKTQLFPGHEGLLSKQNADRPLDENEMRLLAVQGQRFIGAGIVSYRDIFGKRHITTFKCVSTLFVRNDVMETAPTDRGNHSS